VHQWNHAAVASADNAAVASTDNAAVASADVTTAPSACTVLYWDRHLYHNSVRRLS